jgi:hypothetical protein
MSKQPVNKKQSKAQENFLKEHFGGNTPQLHWYVTRAIRLYLTTILIPKNPRLNDLQEVKDFTDEQ